MILLFGGTTEGKQAIKVLTALRCSFVYSTKTKVSVSEDINYRYGALDQQSMTDLIQEQNIRLIVNCAHPFASRLHDTIHAVASRLNIDVIRMERIYPTRTIHPLVHYIDNYTKALSKLAQFNQPTLLALTGVQSISKLKAYWKKTRCYFRILDREESKLLAASNDFPFEQLILGLPNGALVNEINTIRQHNIGIILTKESGESGGLSTKIEAAIACNVPILIISKPLLPTSFILAKSTNELHLLIKNHVSVQSLSKT
ncbi:precorrin-6A/cobalt-precorrin-6A reductase [Reichenbachiella versicolor]|uniref:precorrin-6A/cobalt-precorrin-6A reductase n=1 Tax=Reichenbachiella versicolor TaxID=1821036 RepID=UPI000D6E5D25|nr:precorrin-6A/cobalt-precorrin-6A reductase [Reichenbachiella versicolor]